jgi:hypothetical protein
VKRKDLVALNQSDGLVGVDVGVGEGDGNRL